MARTTQEWIDAVKKMRGYVKTYLAVPKLNAKQQAALKVDLATLDKNLEELQAAIAAGGLSGDASDGDFLDIGPDPLPNNALPTDATYGCDGTAAEIEGRFGRPITTLYNEVFTAILRPNEDHRTPGDAQKQKRMVAYFAGSIPFSAIASDLGSWFDQLGCVPDLAAIHDLGA